jgi:hypothetical protein
MTDDLQLERIEALAQEAEGIPQRALAAKDPREQSALVLRWRAIGLEIKQIKDELLARLEALCAAAKASVGGDARTRMSRLIEAYRFAVRFKNVANDNLTDVNLHNKAALQARDIRQLLDTLAGGPQWALPMLEDEDIGVRCNAAIHLGRSAPERAIPVLREITEQAEAYTPRMDALSSLSRFEEEQRQS